MNKLIFIIGMVVLVGCSSVPEEVIEEYVQCLADYNCNSFPNWGDVLDK